MPSDGQSVFLLEKPIYTNNVIAIAGINASGKTSALQLIRLALSILTGRSIDNFPLLPCFDLFKGDITFAAAFYKDGSIWVLESELAKDSDPSGEFGHSLYVFTKERLYRHSATEVTKKELLDVALLRGNSKLISEREGVETYDDDRFISSTMSIAASLGRNTMKIFTLGANEMPFMPIRDAIETDEALHLLDSNIEYMKKKSSKDALFEMKLKSEPEPLTVNDRDLRRILSTGTLRGLRIIDGMFFALKSGGYALLDEAESHLNKQIVRVLIDTFASADTNPLGATLIFTTHYPELLDDVRRKDNTYFLVRDKDSKTCTVKYSTAIKRIENKKSEVFLSNYIKGTAPKYSDIEALRSVVRRTVSAATEEETS